MKRRIYVICIVLIIPLMAFPQRHMRFMGIPIDGKAELFCQQLERKGFLKDKEDVTNGFCYVGKFYGEDACIQVDYTHDTHMVYSVTVYIIKSDALSLIPIQRNYLQAVEEKYNYKKEVIDPQSFTFDYYIFDELNPIGLIQTFIVDSKIIPSLREAMLSITYTDIDNYLNYENRKREDI